MYHVKIIVSMYIISYRYSCLSHHDYVLLVLTNVLTLTTFVPLIQAILGINLCVCIVCACTWKQPQVNHLALLIRYIQRHTRKGHFKCKIPATT